MPCLVTFLYLWSDFIITSPERQSKHFLTVVFLIRQSRDCGGDPTWQRAVHKPKHYQITLNFINLKKILKSRPGEPVHLHRQLFLQSGHHCPFPSSMKIYHLGLFTPVIPVSPEEVEVSPVTVTAYSSFESMVLQLNGPTPTVLVTVYRPPKPNKDFINDFSAFLTHLTSLSSNIILLGDFNIRSEEHTSELQSQR